MTKFTIEYLWFPKHPEIILESPFSKASPQSRISTITIEKGNEIYDNMIELWNPKDFAAIDAYCREVVKLHMGDTWFEIITAYRDDE